MVKGNLKKISVNDLQVGMFIVNLGISWIRHPFFRNQLKVNSEKQIEKLKKHNISEVYIDPDRGTDVLPPKFGGEETLSPLRGKIEPRVDSPGTNGRKTLSIPPHGSPVLCATHPEENPLNHEA